MVKLRNSFGQFIKLPAQVKQCIQCSQEYKRNGKFSNLQWDKSKYCSRDCSNLYKRIHKTYVMPDNRGRIQSEREKELNRVAHLRENSSFWKDGRSLVKGYYTHKALERYARLKGAEGSFSLGEWQELLIKYQNRCVICLKSGQEVKLTKDHIIPLTRGGSNYINNIQPLCQSCNSRKGNRVVDMWEGSPIERIR